MHQPTLETPLRGQLSCVPYQRQRACPSPDPGLGLGAPDRVPNAWTLLDQTPVCPGYAIPVPASGSPPRRVPMWRAPGTGETSRSSHSDRPRFLRAFHRLGTGPVPVSGRGTDSPVPGGRARGRGTRTRGRLRGRAQSPQQTPGNRKTPQEIPLPNWVPATARWPEVEPSCRVRSSQATLSVRSGRARSLEYTGDTTAPAADWAGAKKPK